jgi:hypothetical protein
MRDILVATIRTIGWVLIVFGASFTVLQAWLFGIPILAVGILLERKTAFTVPNRKATHIVRNEISAQSPWLPFLNWEWAMPWSWDCWGWWPHLAMDRHVCPFELSRIDTTDDIELDIHRRDDLWFDLDSVEEQSARSTDDYYAYGDHTEDKLDREFDDWPESPSSNAWS